LCGTVTTVVGLVAATAVLSASLNEFDAARLKGLQAVRYPRASK
jgi:hypothetical protein